MSKCARSGPCLLLLVSTVMAGCSQERADAQQMQATPDPAPDNVRPLSEALALARRVAPGKVIDVELESDVDLEEQRAPRWVYEIEVLTGDNRVVEMEIDAQSLQLLEIEGAPWPADMPKPAP